MHDLHIMNACYFIA